jgi:regulator of replication initiation timing
MVAAESADRNVSLRLENDQLRAELATAKSILNDETNRAERAEAELAAERARLDWLWDNADDIYAHDGRVLVWLQSQEIRAAIDAAMKEGTK